MIDFLKLPSPCYVLDEELLDRNLATVDRVRRESGAEIIVALKACAMWSIFPELAKHSDGATASSAAEARLVFEEFGRPAHTYAPVYTDSNIDEILNCSDHITFNSLSQFRRFGQKALINGISCGLRINPQYSPVETAQPDIAMMDMAPPRPFRLRRSRLRLGRSGPRLGLRRLGRLAIVRHHTSSWARRASSAARSRSCSATSAPRPGISCSPAAVATVTLDRPNARKMGPWRVSVFCTRMKGMTKRLRHTIPFAISSLWKKF